MDHLKHILAIDIGNTRSKAAVFKGNECLVSSTDFTIETVGKEWFDTYPISYGVVGLVGKQNNAIKEFLEAKIPCTYVNGLSKLPFKSLYQTPETLGVDRIAGVAGAMHFFPDKACLIIDIGTCITFDFIDAQNNYHGGSISPGLKMRLDAMHQFTHKLPALQFKEVTDWIGNTTDTSMLSGAFYGITGEIIQWIERYKQKFGDLQVILCGGDAALFGKQLKNDIFAAPNLVLYGLNKILLFDVEKGA